MLNDQQLQELLEIRRQIDALQTRYNEIMLNAGTPAATQPESGPSPAGIAQAPAPAVPATAAQPPPQTGPVPVQSAPLIPAPSQNLSSAITLILINAGKPLSFNTIYSQLENSGAPLPPEKPMLTVRRLLHDTTKFEVVKGGLFKPRQDIAPEPEAPPQKPPTPSPVVPPKPVNRPTASFTDKLNAILGN